MTDFFVPENQQKVAFSTHFRNDENRVDFIVPDFIVPLKEIHKERKAIGGLNVPPILHFSTFVPALQERSRNEGTMTWITHLFHPKLLEKKPMKGNL